MSGNPDIRISGYPEIRKSGYPEIRISGNPDFGKSGYQSWFQSSHLTTQILDDCCASHTTAGLAEPSTWEYAINNDLGFNRKLPMRVRWSELCELVWFGSNHGIRMKAQKSGAKPSSRVQSLVVGIKPSLRVKRPVFG